MVVNPVGLNGAKRDVLVDLVVHATAKRHCEAVDGSRTPKRRAAQADSPEQRVYVWVELTLAVGNHRPTGVSVNVAGNSANRFIVAAEIPRHTQILVEVVGCGGVPTIPVLATIGDSLAVYSDLASVQILITPKNVKFGILSHQRKRKKSQKSNQNHKLTHVFSFTKLNFIPAHSLWSRGSSKTKYASRKYQDANWSILYSGMSEEQ